MTDTTILFRGVRVFDGEDDRVYGPRDVLVAGGRVARITDPDAPLTPDADPVPVDMQVINGGGTRVLMPGLIDAHWHAAYTAVTIEAMRRLEPGYFYAIMTKQVERTLLRGFTTVRDLSGPVIGLKRAIDDGLVPGPRIYPCGAAISQTGGHGDFRLLTEIPRDGASPLSYPERLGGVVLADGVPEVLRGVREQLMHGASQIKVMAGGGVASDHDPLDVTQYTLEEMQAAVRAAENWGTYVAVHAYTDRAVRQAVDAGVRCIEHGQLVNDDDTVELLAKHGVWWSLQPFIDDGNQLAFPEGTINWQKQQQLFQGTETAYRLAIKHGVKIAWGTDILFSAEEAEKQGAMLAGMTKWFSPAEALRIATGRNAELLAMSGPRNPYPGQLGVIKEGAHADLLLVDGDPVADISLLADPDTNLPVIVKGGSIVKNTLTPGENSPRRN